MIGFLKPADSRPVRVWACVAASGSGPTKTRKIPSLPGMAASTPWNPFLPSASAMISASGRAVATTCQYWPPEGSPAAAACTGAGDGDGLGLVSLARAGAGVAGAGAGGSDWAGLVDSGGADCGVVASLAAGGVAVAS